MSEDTLDRNNWALEKKLAVIVETASLNEHDLSAYCRKNGLYVDQINQWKQSFIDDSHKSLEPNLKGIREELRKSKVVTKQSKAVTKQSKAENKILKQELRRKDKALAEAEALLVLRKKVIAIWGEREAG